MKKLTILTFLAVLTGLAAGFQTPKMSVIEKPDLDIPSDFEPSEKPDLDPGFETELTHSYESDLVDFNTSESVEADPEGLENIPELGNNNETANKTAENSEEPDQNQTREENDETSSYSSGSGSSDYSTPSIEVEISEDAPNTNKTDENDSSSSSNHKKTQETEEKTQPGIFGGPWTETGDAPSSLQERLTGRFSESTTLGGITLLVFGGLAVYSYW